MGNILGRHVGNSTRISLIIVAILGTLMLSILLIPLYRHSIQLKSLPEAQDSLDLVLPSTTVITSGSTENNGAKINHTFVPAKAQPWDPSICVVGPVTDNFRDNLREDTNYVTAWAVGGFTNEFFGYVNMIYLGIISDRVPVVPPFSPMEHISYQAGVLPFGTVFDLPGFRKALHQPILEWSDIQSPPSSPPSSSQPPHALGCWSAWVAGNPRENKPRPSGLLADYLNLDISYTGVPKDTRRLQDPKDYWDAHLLFWPLAEIIFPANNRDIGVQEAQFPSPLGSRLPPDSRLACFDVLYYLTAGTQEFEWDHAWSPAWRFVGRYLRFAEPLLELGKMYVRKALGVDELPPIITIHARRGDIISACPETTTKEECYAPITAFARRVKEVQDELLEKKGIEIPDQHVLLTSDEQDPTFWSQISRQGWKYINHTAENTVEVHGDWYPALVDIVAQSLGMGFVGTDRSTVSIVSRWRVEVWNDGVTRTVMWGRPGADDH